MAVKKKKQSKAVSLPGLKESTASLDFLGSLWRTAFFAALMLVITAANFIHQHYQFASSDYAQRFGFASPLASTYPYVTALTGLIVSVLVFAAYDCIYTAIVRRYPLWPILDKIVLFSLELLFAVLALLTFALTLFVNVNQDVYDDLDVIVFSFFVIAAVLPLVRAFVGVSYAVTKNKR